MKKRRIYYRRRKDKIIIEGKSKGKSIHIFTLPGPEKFIKISQQKACFFTKERAEKIDEILKRVDFKKNKDKEDA